MPIKRGRPLSNPDPDPRIQRKRELMRQRQQARYQRLREARAAIIQPTIEQDEQRDLVLQRPFVGEDVPPTPAQLGLRVQGLTLAQDPAGTQLQQQSVEVDDHHTLYDSNGHLETTDQLRNPRVSSSPPHRAPPSSPPPPREPAHPRRRSITQSSTSLPTPNPLRDHRTQSPRRPSPAISSFSPPTDASLEPEPSALETTVEKLFDMIHDGFHGCPVEEHAQKLQQHITQYGDNHHGLSQLFSDPAFPSVIRLSDFLTRERLDQWPEPSPRQWESMFCGVPADGPRGRPRQVCLHAEETREMEPAVSFDVDSFLGFASSLAVARQGVWHQPAPQVRQNLRTDVHINTTIYTAPEDPEEAPRARIAMLKDVAHCYLGRVEGATEISLYVLFPYLTSGRDDFISLTANQHSRWLDQVFYPAVYDHFDGHYTQHLPASYRHSLAHSQAQQIEGRMADSASYQAQQSLHYHLQPEHLHAIWEQILHTTSHTPGLRDLRDPQLFFSAKDTKLRFKTRPSRPTVLDVMDAFQAYFEGVMDQDYIFLDRFYVDLGKEICPSVGLLPHVPYAVDDEPQVYLWRRCCLEHHLRWLYDGAPPKSKQTFYHQNMLRDACGLTSLTPRRSRFRQGGLLYSQFYNSVKEMIDAAKSFPFHNDGLEEMALDPQIRQGARHAGGNVERRSLAILEKAYCASKRRTVYALQDSVQKSFGVREEHRIAWPLFQALRGRLEREGREELEVILIDCPAYVWPIQTAVYADFVLRNVDKFTTGFEVVLTRCQQDYVTWEQTKIMAMFLRCLRFALGSHQLSRESALWWSRRETGPPESRRTWYGLGFSNTLRRYGYGWIEPRIDWERLTFQAAITDEVLFGNRTLRSQYLRRGGQVQDFHDVFLQMELALGWIRQYRGSTWILSVLLSWIIHLCLHQFRVDTLTSVKGEIQRDHRTAALHGQQPFSYEYFEEIMGHAVHLVSGNKSDFKDPLRLAHTLFDFDDGHIRTHWENKPYRKLYRRAYAGLREQDHTGGLANSMRKQLWPYLFAFHWILPYPSTEVFTQTTKQGARMWYSIRPSTEVGEDLTYLDPQTWRWARKDWRAGYPQRLPRFLEQSKAEWQAWLSRH